MHDFADKELGKAAPYGVCDLATVINLICATTTETGLKFYCDIDDNHYPKGVAVDKATMETLNIRRDQFHGEWNYTLLPVLKDDAVI